MVTKEYLLTSSEKDDYTATEDTGVSLGSQNRKKKISSSNAQILIPGETLTLCVCVCISCSVVSDSLQPMDGSWPGSICIRFSQQEYWRDCHSLLQGILLTQESNPGFLHCRQILYCLSHQGSPDSVTATAAKSLQSCPTLCDPRDGSPPGFPVPGILQARTLEWVSISFPNA